MIKIVNKKKKQTLTIRITDDVYFEVERRAEREGCSKSELCDAILADYFKINL